MPGSGVRVLDGDLVPDRVIRLGVNAIPAKAREAILEVFDSGQFSPGPKVRQFEETFAKAHGAKHAVFTNSGTDALRIALLALKEKYGWLDGDKVVVPSLTFVATVNVVLQASLTPFFVDVGMNDYLINPHNLERRLNPGEKIRAVMPVHLFGKSCGDEIYGMAKKRGWKVLEDSCETILNPLRGNVSCHSTYMAHHLTTGVGGMAVTNDGELNLLMRSYANHGRNASYLPGYLNPPIGENLIKSRFRFDRIGYSCRGTEFEAALGLSQFDGLEESMRRRRDVALGLTAHLMEFRDLGLPDASDNTWMMYPIVIKEMSDIDKYDLCLHLENCGIETREMMPVTNQPCYKHLVNEDEFSVAKWINAKGFYIPCVPTMTQADVEYVYKAFKAYGTLDKQTN